MSRYAREGGGCRVGGGRSATVLVAINAIMPFMFMIVTVMIAIVFAFSRSVAAASSEGEQPN